MTDDQGRTLDAEYHLEADPPHLALILESRSGSSGDQPPRNPDYNAVLCLLLTRLAAMDAVLVAALVDSRHTQSLDVPEDSRRLIESPVRLAHLSNIEDFRRHMGTRQAKIAQAAGATKGGNSTRRIRLRLEVPGYQLDDAARLGSVLAGPASEGSRQSIRVAPVDEVEEAVRHAAGKPMGRGGQGFQTDQEAKLAVERHAMKAATEFYGRDWTVEDVHSNQSYDLVCTRGQEVKYVEVKGTTTDGTEVLLTRNEVEHARTKPNVALFVLSNVLITKRDGDAVVALGGVCHIYDPWRLADGVLTPIAFRYQLPVQPDGDT